MIDKAQWPKGPTKDAAYLAKKFEVQENTIFAYAKKYGLPLKRRKPGAKTRKLKAPKLGWHKKVVILMKTEHPPTIRQIANMVRKSYAATYLVVKRYKMYRAKQEYV